MEVNDTLYIIPARGGSKGLPRKNILPINDKPLICYTIDAARGVTDDKNICVSTDDAEIKQVVESYGLKVHFTRPAELANDKAGSREVILHAIDFYKQTWGKIYSKVCLLQPTSPLRTSQHIIEAFKLWNDNIDMVVSVKISHAATVLCLENKDGYVELCFNTAGKRRQEVPVYYEYNGAIYIINVERLKSLTMNRFTFKKKYVMDAKSSIDIDTHMDFHLAKLILQQGSNF